MIAAVPLADDQAGFYARQRFRFAREKRRYQAMYVGGWGPREGSSHRGSRPTSCGIRYMRLLVFIVGPVPALSVLDAAAPRFRVQPQEFCECPDPFPVFVPPARYPCS